MQLHIFRVKVTCCMPAMSVNVVCVVAKSAANHPSIHCRLCLLRASIMVDYKQAEFYMKEAGVSQTAGRKESFILCLWANTCIPAGLQPVAGAERALGLASRLASRRNY